MRDFLRSSGRRLRAGWFWPLVLLSLPNCVLPVNGLSSGNEFDPGSAPITSAVMCDIPKVPDPANGDCADATDVGIGMSRAHAAVALAEGDYKSLALDYSVDATNACGGFPRKTELFGPFPDGFAVCLNCPQMIPAAYADGNAVCVAKCKELVSNSGGPEPPGGLDAFCAANAHVSTNFEKNTCYDNACSDGGTLRGDFFDPRRNQEPVKWTTQNGTTGGDSGNNITRTAGRSGNFDAGAYSAQTITHGDAWVEFGVSDDVNKAYALGVSPGATDGDETLADLAFAIVLQNDGKVYVYEGGSQVGGDHGTYNATDRFRVHVVDNNDGKATISYSKLIGSCPAGTKCNEDVFATGAAPSPAYPLRVDVSLVDPGANLTNVTLVRIQDPQ